MIELRVIFRAPTSAAASKPQMPLPRLAVPWTGRREQFISSLLVLIRGPASPRKFRGEPFFRDCWIEQPFPKLWFLVSVACQVLLVIFPPPIWNIRPPRTYVPPTEEELVWYGPVQDLPALLPAKLLKTAPESPRGARDSESRRGAEAFHPRQTIITMPLHPTHPRQTLVEPVAPSLAPKILPPLPNIVQLARSEPARPKLQLTPEQLEAMRPKAPQRVVAKVGDTPQVAIAEKQTGPIDLASSAQAPPRPSLLVDPMSAPHAVERRAVADAAAPDISTGVPGGTSTLIALSATPAPAAPPEMPVGNLSARLSISPEGPQPGVPGGRAEGKAGGAGSGDGPGAGGNGRGEGGGRGPEGIFISGGNGNNPSSTSGLGIGSATRRAGGALLARRGPSANPGVKDAPVPPISPSGPANLTPGTPPEAVLEGKRVYTLHVNMPNMTSASGSWILNFAEMDQPDWRPFPRPAADELSGPVPLRKVDPKYPPELRTEHVEGEVVLYAVIRKDGSVDSIQLVRGVDPQLDANAMDALAQWKFRPAEKQGAPVDLEAVVYIPFRSRPPTF